MKRKLNYTKEEIIEAARKSGGILSNMASILGVTYVTARRYLDRYVEAKDIFNTERIKLRGKAESLLAEALNNGQFDLKIISYVLTHIKPYHDCYDDIEDFSNASDEELEKYEQAERNNLREM